MGGRTTRIGERWPILVVWPAVGLLIFVLPPARGADVRLSEPLPTAFRGVAWQDAVSQVAVRLGASYTFERNITAEQLNCPVRLSAEFLTGEEVLRWLARLGGVAVVPAGGRFVFGRPDAWPSAWRVRATGPWTRSGPSGETQEVVQSRAVGESGVADIEWSDQTPSAALAEIRTKYGMDVMVEPAVLARDELLTIAKGQIRLPELLTEIAGAWGVTWAYEDGAAALGSREWVTGLVGGVGPSGRSPGTGGTAGARRLTRGPDDGASDEGDAAPDTATRWPRWGAGWIRLEAKEKSWKKALWPMMQLMGAAARWRVNGTSRPRIADSALEAEGNTGEVLEGLRLLGYLRWQQPAAGASANTVEIRLE